MHNVAEQNGKDHLENERDGYDEDQSPPIPSAQLRLRMSCTLSRIPLGTPTLVPCRRAPIAAPRLCTSRIARNIKKTARTLVYDPNVPSDRALLEVLRSIRPIEGPALDAIAARAGWSPFHLHRAFRAMVGETPKQYTLRRRLERAVARLITSGDAVLDIALAMGREARVGDCQITGRPPIRGRVPRKHGQDSETTWGDVVRAPIIWFVLMILAAAVWMLMRKRR